MPAEQVPQHQASASTVGVIVPVHGWAPYLAETLDAILTQRPPPNAVVVVDDGSPEPLRLHPDHAGRCQLERRSVRGGLASARATGLAHLGTELVALCDDDDSWTPGSLAARVRALAAHPEAVLAFGPALIVGPDGRPTGERWEELAPGPHTATQLRSQLYARNPIPVSSVVVRAQALRDVGGLDSDLDRAEDWELWLRLLGAGHDFVFEPGGLVRYRRQPGALSADVARLAESGLMLHARHARLVDEPARRQAQAADLCALADGLIRQRRYRGAREALARARRLGPLPPRPRRLRAVLFVPGLRRTLGRRDPYRPSGLRAAR